MYSYHIHSTFSDGKNTPEEIVLTAIEKGYHAIGFSDHGYTDYDLRYCMTDQDGYVKEINRLKEKYRHQIQVSLGIEEDAFAPVDRQLFDYVIGSCHYVPVKGNYYSVDSNRTYLEQALAAFDGDPLAFAQSYYSNFCQYVKTRKPDIIGHFDLITKFDESGEALFLSDPEYHKLSQQYIRQLLNTGCIFEINTGALARGIRTTPYPHESLLRILQQNKAPILLSSDSHAVETLDFAFEEMKAYLKDLGFTHLKVYLDSRFQDIAIEKA